jgi:hypothetical protein
VIIASLFSCLPSVAEIVGTWRHWRFMWSVLLAICSYAGFFHGLSSEMAVDFSTYSHAVICLKMESS